MLDQPAKHDGMGSGLQAVLGEVRTESLRNLGQ
jgi:hypothetical protein